MKSLEDITVNDILGYNAICYCKNPHLIPIKTIHRRTVMNNQPIKLRVIWKCLKCGGIK